MTVTTPSSIRLPDFPKPRLHLSPPKNRLPFEPLDQRYWDHSTWVIRWMTISCFRYLTAHQKAGIAFPSTDELAAWLLEVSEPRARQYLDPDDIAAKCADAARFAVDTFDPQRYERSARGGRANRIELTDDQLASVLPLSHAEAAKVLHVSKSTVQRRRREWGRVTDEVDPAKGDDLLADPTTGEVIEILETNEDNDSVTGEILETTDPATEGWPPRDTGDIPAEWHDDPGVLALREAAQQARTERLTGLDLAELIA